MKTREDEKLINALMMCLVLSAYLRLRHSYRRGSFRQVPPAKILGTRSEGRIRGRAAALHMLYDGPCGEHKRRERKAHSSAPRADQGRGLLPPGSLAEKLSITKENFTYSASERETLLGGCP